MALLNKHNRHIAKILDYVLVIPMFSQFASLFECSRITRHPDDTVLTSCNIVYQRLGNETRGFFAWFKTQFSLHLVSHFENKMPVNLFLLGFN